MARKQTAHNATEELIEEIEKDKEIVHIAQTPYVGAWVLYVMNDGVTVRPMLVTSFYTRTIAGEQFMYVNGQVFVDGSEDDGPVRGPAAHSSLQDYKRDVLFDDGDVRVDYAANTWHWRA